VYVCLFVNAITPEPFEISLSDFYGSKIRSKTRTNSNIAACIPMHCGRGWWFNDSDVLVAIRTVLSSVSICVCMCLYVSICVCVTVYRKATRVFTSRHWLVTLMSLKSYCSMALKSISSHRSRCHSSSVCLSVCPRVCLFTNTRGSLFCQILIDLNIFLLLQQRSNDLLVVREPCRPKMCTQSCKLRRQKSKMNELRPH